MRQRAHLWIMVLVAAMFLMGMRAADAPAQPAPNGPPPSRGASVLESPQWLNQPPGTGGASRTCPAANEWLLLYWGGQETPIQGTIDACTNANRFWVRRGSRWIGYAVALVLPGTNDEFQVQPGEAAFVHGAPLPDPDAIAGGQVTAARAAALRELDAVDAPSAEACRTHNPQHKPCVVSSPASAQGGVAMFGVADPGPGTSGFFVVMAQDRSGSWRYWLSGQQAYQLFALPGDMIVCADGGNLSLRSAPDPSASVTGTVLDLTRVRVEEFVLTDPGNFAGRTAGSGWYRLSAPQAGWAPSTSLTAAALGDCTLRNSLVSGGR
jgi:hypothetical protein